MSRQRPDPTDLRIMAILQDAGRTPNVVIAREVGVTAPPASRRIRRLEDERHIRGYHARLNADGLGFRVMAFLLVALKRQHDRALRAFSDKISGWPLVRECHALSGQHDFLLRCSARSMEEIVRFTSDQLATDENVETTRTLFCVAIAKETTGVPLAAPGGDAPDEVRARR